MIPHSLCVLSHMVVTSLFRLAFTEKAWEDAVQGPGDREFISNHDGNGNDVYLEMGDPR